MCLERRFQRFLLFSSLWKSITRYNISFDPAIIIGGCLRREVHDYAVLSVYKIENYIRCIVLF